MQQAHQLLVAGQLTVKQYQVRQLQKQPAGSKNSV
jgi:hypothetical protein